MTLHSLLNLVNWNKRLARLQRMKETQDMLIVVTFRLSILRMESSVTLHHQKQINQQKL